MIISKTILRSGSDCNTLFGNTLKEKFKNILNFQWMNFKVTYIGLSTTSYQLLQHWKLPKHGSVHHPFQSQTYIDLTSIIQNTLQKYMLNHTTCTTNWFKSLAAWRAINSMCQMLKVAQFHKPKMHCVDELHHTPWQIHVITTDRSENITLQGDL